MIKISIGIILRTIKQELSNALSVLKEDFTILSILTKEVWF